MRSFTFCDFETDLTAPGNQAPDPVCAVTWHPQDGARLWMTAQLPEMLDRTLCAGETLVGHDFARFDSLVIANAFPRYRPALWTAFEEGRVLCTMMAQRAIEINRGEKGKLRLDEVAKYHGVPFIEKDEWQHIRTSFGRFKGAASLPPAHYQYVMADGEVLPAIFERQIATGLVDLSDLAELSRQSFGLSLVSARGFRTDPARVLKLEALLKERLDDLQDIAEKQGFLRRNAKGETSRYMRAIHEAIAHDYAPDAAEKLWAWRQAALDAWTGKRTTKTWEKKAEASYAEHTPAPAWLDDPRIPKTDKGNVRADRLVLEDAKSPQLQALSEWARMLSIQTKDLKAFWQGTQEPLHTYFGLADTGRSTSSNPNAQNWGKLAGVRECIVARPGYALGATDYSMLELVAIAQLCVERLGLHDMANKINAGVDMHAEIGADILGISYEEVMRLKKIDETIKKGRDSGKPANFGLNGGMSSEETFQLYARKSYEQNLTLEECRAIMAAWRRRAHDQQAYIRSIRRMRNKLGKYSFQLPRFNNLWRHGRGLTDACNNPFQGLGGRVATRGLWKVLKAQYCTGEMAGSHAVMYVHDDITSEMPISKAKEHLAIQERLMCEASREVCPDVFAGVESELTSHLSKAPRGEVDEWGVMHVPMPERLGG